MFPYRLRELQFRRRPCDYLAVVSERRRIWTLAGCPGSTARQSLHEVRRPGILATQCVVPQGRFWDVRINVRQTDDEIVQPVRSMTACIYIRRRTMRYRHWDKIMSTVLTANTSRQRTFEKLDYSTSDCKYGQNCSSLPWDVILYHGPVTPCELINSFNYVLFTRSMLLHGRELPQYDVCL